MPRTRRIKAPGNVYSVVTRVNNSEFCFADFSLSEAFLEHLKEVKEEHKFKLYAFVIMSSHVHLLIEPNDEISDISRIMRHINGQFAQKFNSIYNRKGHFWMQRFSSKIVEWGQYMANTIIYFALNPVKAGVTDNPLKYTYSSIHNITQNKYAGLVDELPEELNETIKEFLKRNNFIELLEKCIRVMKKFSFDLDKSIFDQRFKYFIGSNSFMNKYKQQFQNIFTQR